jgi:drug/metabolite transporter (DMT)-like permease
VVAGRLRAIVSMIVAVAAFAGMDALLKILSTNYPPFEVAVLRGVASLPFMLAPIVLSNRWELLKPRRFPMHLLRGALQVLVLGGFIYSVRSLSLANTYAVFLSAPLMMTALAVPILKERTDARGWAAILAGLIGVLIMLRPSVAGFVSLGSLAALGAAFGYAVNGIAVRVLTRTDTTASVVVWTISLMTLMSLALALPGWVPLEPRHYRWLLLLGALAAVGSYGLTEAFRAAPAAVVAPLEYTSLLWGVIIDRAVWGVLPSMRVICGGAVVIASGLYLVWGERTRVRNASRGSGAQSEAEWHPPRPLQHARQQEEDAP